MVSRGPVVEKLASIPPFWRLVFMLLVSGTLLGVWLFSFVHYMLVSGEDLPVALHSPLEADYSADLLGFIPAARINLLREAIADQAREGNNTPAERIATMVDQMRTPVFTITPYPGMTSQPGAAATRVQTQTAVSPSQTPAVPTGSASATIQTPSATATATQAFTFTVTPVFVFHTNTPKPTQPPVFASPTHTSAPTQVPATQTAAPQQPTNTLPPPTNTPQPEPPTNTPVPPATNTVAPYPPPGTSYP